jgi:hypothetical protein
MVCRAETKQRKKKMKKIIVAMIAVASAMAVNAAAINWASSNAGLNNPDGTAAGGEGYITMYLFTLDKTGYDALSVGGAAGVSAAVWGAYGSKLATATDSYADDGMGQIMLADPNSYGVGDTAYAAVIFAYDEGEGVTHYKGNIASYTFDSASDVTVYEMDTLVFGDKVGTAAVTWQAVPEPTSGLLMLVGLAGLALRRRRA